MKIRMLIVGFAVASLSLIGVVSTSSAQEQDDSGGTGTEESPTPDADQPAPAPTAETSEGEGDHGDGGGHGLGECLEKAVHDGTDPAACHEAPNPILPEVDEIIWGGAAFLVVLAVMWKFAVPPVKAGLEDRTERIRSDLEAADQAKLDAEKVLADYKADLADAKNEANRILEDARASAEVLRKDLAAKAESDIAEQRRRAAADIESAKEQALGDLRAEVAKLVIGAAEVVIEKNLDQATQVQLIENYINQVGSRS